MVISLELPRHELEVGIFDDRLLFVVVVAAGLCFIDDGPVTITYQPGGHLGLTLPGQQSLPVTNNTCHG